MEQRPRTLEDLVEAVGEEPAARLVRLAGGLRLYVPRPDNAAGSALERQVGPELAARLADAYQGEFVEVPCLRPRSHRVDRMALFRLVAAHPEMQVNELASRAGVTTRWITEIRRQVQAAEADEPPLIALSKRSTDTCG